MKLPKGAPHALDKLPSKTLILTPEQAKGLLERQQLIAQTQAQLNSFLAGVVTGHGYGAVNVTAFDPATRVLTFTPQPPVAE